MLKNIHHFISKKFQTIHLDYRVEMKPRYGWGKESHKLLSKIIAKNRTEYVQVLNKTLEHIDYFTSIELNANGHDSIRWNNGFFPGLDVIALYTILGLKKPKRYIEVGSGNSTKVAYQSKIRNGLKTEIISIDPFPRAEIDNLADKIIRKPFEQLDFWKEVEIEAGDILFIDNSHRIFPNSDAMVFFMETLPQLPKGVIVQIHDVYLPYDYPQFMCDRAYTEQYGLAMYLMANPEKYKPILPNYYISEDAELSAILEPVWSAINIQEVERHGGSFWLEIV